MENGNVELSHCRTEEMVANMLTKGLGREQLRKLRKMSGLDEMPSCSTCESEGVLRKKHSQWNRRVYAEYFVMTICLFQGPNRILRSVF